MSQNKKNGKILYLFLKILSHISQTIPFLLVTSSVEKRKRLSIMKSAQFLVAVTLQNINSLQDMSKRTLGQFGQYVVFNFEHCEPNEISCLPARRLLRSGTLKDEDNTSTKLGKK